jgi:hypothetical protein
MAYTIVDKNPLVRQFVVDSSADLSTIKIGSSLPGSTAFAMAEKMTFMLKHDLSTWIDITPSAASASASVSASAGT